MGRRARRLPHRPRPHTLSDSCGVTWVRSFSYGFPPAPLVVTEHHGFEIEKGLPRRKKLRALVVGRTNTAPHGGVWKLWRPRALCALRPVSHQPASVPCMYVAPSCILAARVLLKYSMTLRAVTFGQHNTTTTMPTPHPSTRNGEERQRVCTHDTAVSSELHWTAVPPGWVPNPTLRSRTTSLV